GYEVEELVAEDGVTESATVHMLAIEVDGAELAIRYGRRPWIAAIVIGAAVELIRAGLGDDRNRGTGAVPELGVYGVLRNIDFLDHIRCGDVSGFDADAHAAAIHLQVIREIGAAADAHPARSPAIKWVVLDVGVIFEHSRIESGQHEGAAVELWDSL